MAGAIITDVVSARRGRECFDLWKLRYGYMERSIPVVERDGEPFAPVPMGQGRSSTDVCRERVRPAVMAASVAPALTQKGWILSEHQGRFSREQISPRSLVLRGHGLGVIAVIWLMTEREHSKQANDKQ